MPEERIEALKHAHSLGFKTSVSVEPMIDTVENTIALYRTLKQYITNDIWFGKMNNVEQRVSVSSIDERYAVDVIKANQSDRSIRMLYEQLKDGDKVKWKDSISSVVRRAA